MWKKKEMGKSMYNNGKKKQKRKKRNSMTERKIKRIYILIFPAFEKDSTSRKKGGML